MHAHASYDTIAADYAAHRSPHPQLLTKLVTLCRARSPLRILEVGCGTGNYVNSLAGITSARCSGLDPSARMLDLARRRNTPVSWFQGFAESLPFPDGSYDFVYSVDILHLVRDRGAFFREAFRVLADGGWFVTVTDSEKTIRQRAFFHYFPEAAEPEVARYPKLGEIPQLLCSSGFQEPHDETIELSYVVSDSAPFERKVFSFLHLISSESFNRGLDYLRRDLQAGPISCVSRCAIYGGRKPSQT
jgi:ubiquinone/menaquinone biosynthesis C-methylase UbiE